MALRARHVLLIAPLMAATGCAMHRPQLRTSAAPVAAVAPSSGVLAEARAALAARNGAAAVSFAELAVRSEPSSAAPRDTLARAYYAAGRLHSASEAFADWLAATPDEPRALLGLALTRIAAGERGAALGVLDRAADRLPASDLGLALALAGDTTRALAVLGDAARQPGATAQARQNLALAHALAGDWAKARAVAVQDLAPEAVPGRLAEWAALANRGSDRRPLLAMLGVTPAESDPGRPSQLAWGAGDTQMAAAPDPAPEQQEADTPEPPAVESPPSLEQVEVRTASVETSVPARFGGEWTVQIGAFADARAAQAGWAELSAVTPLLASVTPMTATAARLHRLTVGSFDTAKSALQFCRQLRDAGVDCFARRADGAPLPGRVTIAARR